MGSICDEIMCEGPLDSGAKPSELQEQTTDTSTERVVLPLSSLTL